ncbi:MAG: MMPL family transporter, partial [Actinobacteria bacterium]
MLQRLARTMYRRRRRVVIVWIAVLIGTFAIANAAGGAFHTNFKLPGSESQAAFDLLKRSGFRERTGVQAQIVFDAKQGVDDSAVRAAVERLFQRVGREVTRVGVVSPYSPEGARQIGHGGHIAYAEVNLADRSQEGYKHAGDQIEALAGRVHVSGVHVALGSDIFAHTNPGGASEAVGVLAAMAILLVAFGSLLAMGLPIMTALFGIGTGAALVLIVRNVVDMPDFTMAAVAMVGIGVGIDYALFIVTRYREALRAGL